MEILKKRIRHKLPVTLFCLLALLLAMASPVKAAENRSYEKIGAVKTGTEIGDSETETTAAAIKKKSTSKTMSQYQIAAIEYTDTLLKFKSSNDCWTKGVQRNTYMDIKFKSSNKKIAVVNKYGEITAKKVGKCKITAKTADRILTIKLTVRTPRNKAVSMTRLQCYRHFRKYMSVSQFKQAYNKALPMIRPMLDLSKTAKLYAVAAILRQYFEENMQYSMNTPHYNDPYGYLIKKSASCAGSTRTTGMFLNMLGVSFEHVNENQYSHQWARVKVGKKYWICDPYGLYVGEEPAARKHPYF